MTAEDVDEILSPLAGVRRTRSAAMPEWRVRGRLVARLLDAEHAVLRSEFEVRSTFVASHPTTFSVPPRFERHMMVVADLVHGDRDAIEDALVAAWSLQSRGR